MITLMIDMKSGKVKVEKTETHEFLGKYLLNLANFDLTLLHTSLRFKLSCRKSENIIRFPRS